MFLSSLSLSSSSSSLSCHVSLVAEVVWMSAVKKKIKLHAPSSCNCMYVRGTTVINAYERIDNYLVPSSSVDRVILLHDTARWVVSLSRQRREPIEEVERRVGTFTVPAANTLLLLLR